MHTILYVGSTTNLAYEQELLSEWGKRSIHLATCNDVTIGAGLAATGTDGLAVAAPAPDPLRGVTAVVIEQGTLTADELRRHPELTIVVLLDDKNASVDIAAATAANVWVARASNRRILTHLPFGARGASGPTRSTRRHALQDALAGIYGERPSGRVNEL